MRWDRHHPPSFKFPQNRLTSKVDISTTTLVGSIIGGVVAVGAAVALLVGCCLYQKSRRWGICEKFFLIPFLVPSKSQFCSQGPNFNLEFSILCPFYPLTSTSSFYQGAKWIPEPVEVPHISMCHELAIHLIQKPVIMAEEKSVCNILGKHKFHNILGEINERLLIFFLRGRE